MYSSKPIHRTPPIVGLIMLVVKCEKKKPSILEQETKDLMSIEKLNYDIRIKVTSLETCLGDQTIKHKVLNST